MAQGAPPVLQYCNQAEIDAAPDGKAVQEAVRYLAKIPDWSAAKMRDAPTAAIPKAWQPHVLDENGQVVDPRAYVFAIIDAWRAAVKRRDIFAKSGITASVGHGSVRPFGRQDFHNARQTGKSAALRKQRLCLSFIPHCNHLSLCRTPHQLLSTSC